MRILNTPLTWDSSAIVSLVGNCTLRISLVMIPSTNVLYMSVARAASDYCLVQLRIVFLHQYIFIVNHLLFNQDLVLVCKCYKTILNPQPSTHFISKPFKQRSLAE